MVAYVPSHERKPYLLWDILEINTLSDISTNVAIGIDDS
jgi:hypothetical protein